MILDLYDEYVLDNSVALRSSHTFPDININPLTRIADMAKRDIVRSRETVYALVSVSTEAKSSRQPLR